MEKLYSLAFLILPLLTQSQQVAYYSKPVSSGFAIGASRPAPNNHGRTSINEIIKNIGRNITLCSKVYSAHQQNDELGQHAVFCVAGNYINEFVDIRIRLDEGYNFTDHMFKTISLKNICITGTVLDGNGAPLVYLDTVNMQNLLNEAEQAEILPEVKSLKGQPLKVLSNAYALAGPRWKDRVITFLKSGSVVVAEQVHKNWAFVKVIERNGENVEVEEIAGYMYTKPLGLGSNGEIITPR